MTPVQQFEAWRAEFVAERESIFEKLPTARLAVQIVETRHAAARDAWIDFNKFAAGAVPNHGSMSGPLYARVIASRDAVDEAERARGGPLAALKTLNNRLADLKLAIDQIDLALTSAKVTQLPRSAEPSRRREPVPVEFDNIVLPREAV